MKKNIDKEEKFLGEIKKHSGFYISVSLFLLLFASFMYNLGYFLPLDLKLLGFLNMSDYYEGTVPYVISFSAVSLLGYFSSIYFSKQLAPITELIVSLCKNLKIFMWLILYTFGIIYMNIRFFIVFYKLNAEKRQAFKKEYNSIKVKQNKLVKNLKIGFKNTTLEIFAIFLCFFIVTIPLILLFNNFRIIILKTAGLFFILIILSLKQLLKGSIKGEIIFSIIFSIVIVFFVGLNHIKKDFEQENIQLEFSNDGRVYYLIRSISNGYIVRYDKDIYFFPKESLTQMRMEVMKKETNNDTK